MLPQANRPPAAASGKVQYRVTNGPEYDRALVCRQSSIDECCGILFLEDHAEGCPSRPGVLRWKNTVLR